MGALSFLPLRKGVRGNALQDRGTVSTFYTLGLLLEHHTAYEVAMAAFASGALVHTALNDLLSLHDKV